MKLTEAVAALSAPRVVREAFFSGSSPRIESRKSTSSGSDRAARYGSEGLATGGSSDRAAPPIVCCLSPAAAAPTRAC